MSQMKKKRVVNVIPFVYSDLRSIRCVLLLLLKK